MFTKESISQELKRINESVPKVLRQTTFTEIKKTPVMEMVFQKAMEDPNITPDKKEKIRKFLATGILSKTQITENPRIAKMRDDYVIRQIKKSVKEGRLPTKQKLKELGLDTYEK